MANEISIIGNGAMKTKHLLPKEGRKDLAKLQIVTDIGNAKSVYVRLDHYLKAVTALEFAENQVRGLETILTQGRDIKNHTDGIYLVRNENGDAISLSPSE